MKVPQETKDMLSVPLRHPLAYVLAMLPAVVSVAVACSIYRPGVALFAPLTMAGFLCLFLLEGTFTGKLTDNHGTAIRIENPLGFWGKFAIWFLGYAFLVAFPVVFALQERDRENQEAKVRGVVPAATSPHGS